MLCSENNILHKQSVIFIFFSFIPALVLYTNTDVPMQLSLPNPTRYRTFLHDFVWDFTGSFMRFPAFHKIFTESPQKICYITREVNYEGAFGNVA